MLHEFYMHGPFELMHHVHQPRKWPQRSSHLDVSSWTNPIPEQHTKVTWYSCQNEAVLAGQQSHVASLQSDHWYSSTTIHQIRQAIAAEQQPMGAADRKFTYTDELLAKKQKIVSHHHNSESALKPWQQTRYSGVERPKHSYLYKLCYVCMEL